ncbi:MAG: type ISP restriction/modification enzyme, partial [Mycobacterium sp.]
EYNVGGRNVLNSWFNYRKKNPGGKKTSPLDGIHINTWPSEWTTEFIDLLTVLTRLTGLEGQQADLLDRILAGPLRTKHDLEQSGVHWPKGPQDRTVRNPITATVDVPTLDLQ